MFEWIICFPLFLGLFLCVLLTLTDAFGGGKTGYLITWAVIDGIIFTPMIIWSIYDWIKRRKGKGAEND